MVEVAQADRDQVQAFHREQAERLMYDIKYRTNLLEAKGDDTDPLVQAFSRHRIAGVNDERARVVAWLRDNGLSAWGADCSGDSETTFYARAIEAGEHLK